MIQDPQATYAKRERKLNFFSEKLEAACQKAITWRVISFIIFFLFVVALFWKLSIPKWILLIPTLICLFVFTKAVKKHRQLELRKKRAKRLSLLNQTGHARINRDWANFPENIEVSDSNTMEGDLLITGHASLLHLVGTPKTALGKIKLREWFNKAASPELIEQRQAAAKELSKLSHFRHKLQHLAENLHENPQGFIQFLEWAKTPSWSKNRNVLKAFIIILPIITVAGMFTHYFTVYDYFWLPTFVIQIIISRIHQEALSKGFASVMTHEGSLLGYGSLFKLIAKEQFSTPSLIEWLKPIQASNSKADEALNQLDKILSFADLKRSELAHFPFQSVLMWDFHVLKQLDTWREQHGEHLEEWLNSLATLEAIAAISILAFENPKWCWPSITKDNEFRIESKAIGHPLISPSQMVSNDFSLGPQGSFLLVTGSNMSGKSTLLRAVGLNMVLAMSGAPVCASSFSAPILTLGTSFRISDALDQGVSYFMAELLRLKEIVDMCAEEPNPPLLYLFDEILLGTNITERQVAVKMIIKHLTKQRTIGAIATHDLSLAEVSELKEKCHCIHFCEQVGESEDGMEMKFDYKLREGVVQTSNALKLLEMVGLPNQE